METRRVPDDDVGGGHRFLPRVSKSQQQREKGTPQKWVQCTFCKKWRQVPYHLKDSDLGDSWECKQNIWDPMYAGCSVPQALSDEQIDAILESCQEVDDPIDVPGSTHHRKDLSSHAYYDEPHMPYRGGRHDEGRRRQDGGDLSAVAETLLTLGVDGSQRRPGSSSLGNVTSSLVPGRVIWGKVEGHDWWPAKVVRRRSVPSEVGPPPGGASEVMFYTPVVFFTPSGIPKEVELSMDSEEFPITICQRACGLIDEDEAEYAWLSADNIRVFCHGDTSGRKDGSLVEDEQLQRCIVAAENDLVISETQTQSWKDDEDSDGGWCCAADFHRNRHQKHKKASRRKSKRLDDGGSDIESGPDDGPELIPYGSFRLAPKIAVEHIYAWRKPLSREEKAKELEKENEEKAMNLRKLAYMKEALQQDTLLTVSLFDSVDFQERSSELQSAPSLSLLDSSDLMQQEREAVSTLSALGPLSEIDGEPLLSSQDEAEYFVKYANRSHLHNEWVKESTLMAFAKRKLTQFKRRYYDEPVDMFSKDWAKPERIISRRKCRTGPGWELLVKWCDLGYEYCTWESENARILNSPETVLLYIDLWRRQKNAVRKKSREANELFHETKSRHFANYQPLTGIPEWLKNSRLHENQMDVVNWFRSMWLDDKGCILTGDPGQGKTAATAAFLQCLREEMKCVHPFLVVALPSQIAKWDGEIDFWSGGQIVTVSYQGPPSARPVCLEHEIWQYMECMDARYPCRETRKIPKPDVVLVSSDIFASEVENLMEVSWSLTVLDSRWVARGGMARLVSAMAHFKCPHFVIASGVPTSEIGLLNTFKLIDPKEAALLESRESAEEGDRDDRNLEHLQSLIKARMLEVEHPVRPFPQQAYKEILIPLEFKPEQREQYKESLVKYYDFLKDEGLHRFSIQNVGTLKHIAEELTLICQHPVLADNNEEFDGLDVSQMVEQSGKFGALYFLLHELKEANVHALLLTQNYKTLNLLMMFISDRFGTGTVECVSPSDTTTTRHATAHRFVSGNASFLLSMAEGCGLGMKLAKIKCVVIVESAMRSDDDLLALSRAFQIGDSNELPVFRLFLAGSVEERMLHSIKKSDSLMLSTLSKGTSHDMKMFEDVLIWGTQILFDNQTEARRHPVISASAERSAPCNLNSTTCKALLQQVLLSSTEEQRDDKDPELASIKWRLKTRQDICREYEVTEAADIILHINDPLCIAGYWEQLLRQEWTKKRQREELEHAKKTALQEKDDLMDYEMKEGPAAKNREPDSKEPVKRENFQRPKRFAHDGEALNTSRNRKKQRSIVQKVDSMMMVPSGEDIQNDENKWSREALLSSKAHQDVLTQILLDPNTVEGQAAKEAFMRIDVLSKDLSLPMNVILMAKQVAEVLLTMREDQDTGLYFHDYALLVIIAFASYLGGFHLGEGCGLKALAAKYSQDLQSMEALFNYVTKLMLEYKSMLIKINQLMRNKGSAAAERQPESGGHEGSATMAESAHSLHRDLDVFLRDLSDTSKREKEKEKEFEEDVRKLTLEILDQPPGAPIKGHTPPQWFPYALPSEAAEFSRKARMCDAEMYLIEKSHDSKIKSIEKTFQAFQERVRDYGVKALEKVSYETRMSRNRVEEKKQQLKQEIQNLTQQLQQQHHQHQHVESTTSAAAYGALLAKFQQQTQKWPPQPQSPTAAAAAAQPQPASIHSQQTGMRSSSLLDRSMQQGMTRDAISSHFPSAHSNLEQAQRAPYGATSPHPPAAPIDNWLVAISNSTSSQIPTLHRSPDINAPPVERRNMIPKNTHTVPRVMQYTVPPQPFSLNKHPRSSIHSVKAPFARQSSEEIAGVPHQPSLQAINVAQTQNAPLFSNVLPMHQMAAQSMSIQFPSSPGVHPSIIPNLSSFTFQNTLPPVPSMNVLAMSQHSKTEGNHSAAIDVFGAHSHPRSPGLRVQQGPALKAAQFTQTWPKSNSGHEAHQFKGDVTQLMLGTHSPVAAAAAAAAADPRPIGSRDRPTTVRTPTSDNTGQMFGDQRNVVRLERASSIPTENVTITTGTGRCVGPSLARQSSLTEISLRSTTATKQTNVPGVDASTAGSNLTSFAEAGPFFSPVMNFTPTNVDAAAARAMHIIPPDMTTYLQKLHNSKHSIQPRPDTVGSSSPFASFPAMTSTHVEVVTTGTIGGIAVEGGSGAQLSAVQGPAVEAGWQVPTGVSPAETPFQTDSLNSNATTWAREDRERSTSLHPMNANTSVQTMHDQIALEGVPGGENSSEALHSTSQPNT